ncbi:hypothetical protein GBA65_15195 [Rubrobacter marinus]|uniref:Uncharacterized protein n=1 Tax=Rubrobacter marinus TaxID=2653852 RepID=A0A6G8PZI9_9ACTN|nr:hypothetical protein [Rubrobacter marinus]QIN79649.1 hypothetical protein GBA65_15195 [Rubrobacter marinus]
MGDKAQKRLSSLLVVATFVALQIPLKRLVKELVPGKRGPRDDVAEALVQGGARMSAVVLASTLVRALAGGRRSARGQRGPARGQRRLDQERIVREGRRRGGTRLKVSFELGER